MTKRWDCYGVVRGTKYLGTFEADTADEAEVLASNSAAAGVRLCHQCDPQCEDPEISEIRAEPAD
jgi:hypothetical protein